MIIYRYQRKLTNTPNYQRKRHINISFKKCMTAQTNLIKKHATVIPHQI